MRTALTAITMISATLVLAVPSPERGDRHHRALSTRALSLARGADTENPSSEEIYCDDENTGGGGMVSAGDCSKPFPFVILGQTPCVLCDGDKAEGAESGAPGQGPGYGSTGDTYSCHGKKLVGVCAPDPNNPNNALCATDPWDMKSYCNGEIDPVIFQTDQPPGGGTSQ